MGTSLEITLSEQQLSELRARAARLGLSPEELAQASLADLLEHRDDSFETAAHRVLQKNRKLYERLS